MRENLRQIALCEPPYKRLLGMRYRYCIFCRNASLLGHFAGRGHAARGSDFSLSGGEHSTKWGLAGKA